MKKYVCLLILTGLNAAGFGQIQAPEKTNNLLLRFTHKHYDTTAAAFPGKEKTPACETEYAYPVASGSGIYSQWLNYKIKSLLGIDTTISFERGIKKSVNDYIKNYRESMASDTDVAGSYAGNWQSSIDISIRYNARGYVVLNADVYDYSGGAHGNPASGYFCYDMENRKELKLRDITTADSITLQHLLEAQFRKDNNLSPTDSLTGILFDNYLPPNNNFSFGRSGIYFTYNPYEVAPYVQGIFTVFIPYKKLKGKLNPEFEKRMNIQ